MRLVGNLKSISTKLFFIFCACLLINTPVLAQAGKVKQDIRPPNQLIQDLQKGGYILYLRHTRTDKKQKDNIENDFSDCSQQRNLTAQGRAEAKLIGDKMKQFAVPIGHVYSSPYCRCRDTAKLAFGHFQVERDLMFSMSKKPSEVKFLGQRLFFMMQLIPDDQDNHVFVGHSSNLKEGLGVWPKPEGSLAVFKKVGSSPNGVGRLS